MVRSLETIGKQEKEKGVRKRGRAKNSSRKEEGGDAERGRRGEGRTRGTEEIC